MAEVIDLTAISDDDGDAYVRVGLGEAELLANNGEVRRRYPEYVIKAVGHVARSNDPTGRRAGIPTGRLAIFKPQPPILN